MKRKILCIPEIPRDKVVLLNISRTYNANDKDNSDYIRSDIYEMTRKYWKASKNRIQLADFALGVANGTVVSVYKNLSWEYMEYQDGLRLGFTGERVDNSPYLGLDLSEYVRCQNPIRYVNF